MTMRPETPTESPTSKMLDVLLREAIDTKHRFGVKLISGDHKEGTLLDFDDEYLVVDHAGFVAIDRTPQGQPKPVMKAIIRRDHVESMSILVSSSSITDDTNSRIKPVGS